MSKSRDTGRSAFSLLFGSPLVFSVLCPLSFVATGLFLGLLQDSNRARLWHLLVALQPALWLASVLVVFEDFRSHRLDGPVSRRERTAMVLCTLLAWFMSSFPFLVQLLTQRWALPDDLDALLQLPHLRVKLVLLGMLSALVVTLHTAGMLSVHLQLLASPWESTAREGVPEAVGFDDEVLRYQRLRGRLARFLVFSAVTIGTAALSLGAYRELLLELDPSQVFAPSRVLGYGIYYTGLLASVYLPTRKTLTDRGEALAARFVSSSPAAGTSWKDWSQEQGAVRTWLGLQGTALQDFQQGLSVLAPLLASLSALALGAGG
ncbi:hypothetical protein [Archangium sp.]|uniref:hypothetical protein n=1 Tax=Archangium sp. TaxID=1872627 RepID=UPI00286B4084|nr:hypothetical protein [Archangium sp.]